jgi:hypothetical protein
MTQWNVTVTRTQATRFTVESDSEYGAWSEAVDQSRYRDYCNQYSDTDETTIGVMSS